MSDYSQLIDELLATVALIEVTPDVFEGKSHDYVGSRIFGGQVLAQAMMAAAHTLDQDKPCHSLHGYFCVVVTSISLSSIKCADCEMVAVCQHVK
ncbi:hypothetical protein Psyaliredsea_30780 [Psychrobacter alimentarius]